MLLDLEVQLDPAVLDRLSVLKVLRGLESPPPLARLGVRSDPADPAVRPPLLGPRVLAGLPVLAGLDRLAVRQVREGLLHRQDLEVLRDL